jgi:sugar lactone lactonase YvrE
MFAAAWGVAGAGVVPCQELPTGVDREAVGRTGRGRAVTPVNQVLTPTGQQIDLPGMRPQAVALSPNGSLLAVSGKTSELVVVDPASGSIRQHVLLPSDARLIPRTAPASPHIVNPDDEGQLSYTGLIFSPQGDRIYMSNVEGSIKVFSVARDGEVSPLHSLPLPRANAPRRKAEIPSGLAMTPDGKRLFVCGNMSNRLLEIDVATGQTLRTFAVGVAPYDVVQGLRE